MTINILGTEYEIIYGSRKDYPNLEHFSGYTDTTVKTIIVCDFIEDAEDPFAKQNLNDFKKETVRHEIIHAFLYESGLAGNSHSTTQWAEDEEMVDWMAIQFPKIAKVFEEAGVL
jgi:hypothetical protein